MISQTSLFLFVWSILIVESYHPHWRRVFSASSSSNFRHQASSSSSTWQEDLDKFLDVDTSCDSRRDLTKTIFQRFNEISQDIRTAVQEKNVEKLAPKTLQYGKALQGFRQFQNQLLTDVIPELLTKGVPKLVDEGPKFLSQLLEKSNSNEGNLLERGQKAFENAREILQDPSQLQTTVDELRNEIKNIVKSTPIGLETPIYEILLKTEQYEIRKYPKYSVVTTKYDSSSSSSSSSSAGAAVSDKGTNTIPVDNFSGSYAFQRLAGYIFGDNSRDGKTEKLKMTVPVIMDDQSMSFILPNDIDSTNAPIPDSENIDFKDIVNEVVAVREFTGLVTEGEVNRQKVKLEEDLLAAGITYDAQSFKVLQYNPPYTVPWVRRNEIIVRVDYHRTWSSSSFNEERSVTEDNSDFFASPEAGD